MNRYGSAIAPGVTPVGLKTAFEEAYQAHEAYISKAQEYRNRAKYAEIQAEEADRACGALSRLSELLYDTQDPRDLIQAEPEAQPGGAAEPEEIDWDSAIKSSRVTTPGGVKSGLRIVQMPDPTHLTNPR
jgi:hypothetical protein